MPQQRKYDDDFRMKCFDLYCGGMKPGMIAKEMGCSGAAIQRLKASKWPESWEKGRKDRVAKAIEIVHDNALESLEKIRASNQRKYKSAMDLGLHVLAKKAAAGSMDEKVAADVFFRAGAEQEKAHMTLDSVHGQKGSSAVVGAFAKGNGEVGVLAMLNSRFERNNGSDDPENS